jgi:hypothetical protein
VLDDVLSVSVSKLVSDLTNSSDPVSITLILMSSELATCKSTSIGRFGSDALSSFITAKLCCFTSRS